MVLSVLLYVFWRVYLWITRACRVDRFLKFTDWNSPDPFKYGMFCGPDEAGNEQPRIRIENSEDIVEFFAQNSKEQILFARISRLGNGERCVS